MSKPFRFHQWVLDSTSWDMSIRRNILLRFFIDVTMLYDLVKFPASMWPCHFWRIVSSSQFPLQLYLIKEMGCNFFWPAFLFHFVWKLSRCNALLSGTMCLLCHYLWMADGLEPIFLHALETPVSATNVTLMAASAFAARGIFHGWRITRFALVSCVLDKANVKKLWNQ